MRKIVAGELRRIAKRTAAGETGYNSYSFEGVDKQMFFASTQHGYSLGILFPLSETRAMVHALTFVLLAIAAVALLITAGVIFFITRGLAKFIGSMETVTESLGAGNLTVHYADSGRELTVA